MSNVGGACGAFVMLCYVIIFLFLFVNLCYRGGLYVILSIFEVILIVWTDSLHY